MVNANEGVAKFVHYSPIDVLTIMHLNGLSELLYQSMLTKIYEPAGMSFCSLNEKIYIESEFSVLGYSCIYFVGSKLFTHSHNKKTLIRAYKIFFIQSNVLLSKMKLY